MSIPSPVGPVTPDPVLQLHIAEYNALTTRSSYYIVIAASLYPVLVLIISGMLSLWNHVGHVLIIWGAALAVQGFSFAMIDNARWQYENIYYIENILRPLIVRSVGRVPFWAYERRLSQQRGQTPQWWESSPIFWGGVALIAAPLDRLDELCWPTLHAIPALDWVGFSVSLCSFGIVIWKSVRLLALRRSIFALHLELQRTSPN